MTTALITEDEPGADAMRLKATYGASAGVSLHLNEPRGVVAEIDRAADAA
jgi:hypothetical protein